jgi:hypothetical protein
VFGAPNCRPNWPGCFGARCDVLGGLCFHRAETTCRGLHSRGLAKWLRQHGTGAAAHGLGCCLVNMLVHTRCQKRGVGWGFFLDYWEAVPHEPLEGLCAARISRASTRRIDIERRSSISCVHRGGENVSRVCWGPQLITAREVIEVGADSIERVAF